MMVVMHICTYCTYHSSTCSTTTEDYHLHNKRSSNNDGDVWAPGIAAPGLKAAPDSIFLRHSCTEGTYICIRTYIHTYMFIHTQMHTLIYTYIIYIQCTSRHTYTPITYTQVCTKTYILCSSCFVFL